VITSTINSGGRFIDAKARRIAVNIAKLPELP
jgi:hypothetical protein